MTDLRQAAQQALEALEYASTGNRRPEIIGPAITALKAALEQPEQGPTCPECKAAVLYECVACSSNNYPPKPQPEPVACVIDGDLYFHHEIDWEDLAYQGHGVELLYTTPPAAQAAPVQEPVVFYRCNGCGHAYEQVHPTRCDCMDAGGFDRVEYFTTPPAAQPEQEFDYKLAFGEWLDKTEWVQEKINSGHLGVRYLGMHRADVLRDLAYPNTVTGKAPQQRKWQGLTDDQIDEIAVIARRGNLHDLRIAIEAKLKERNNG
jgi:hypothetical protein